MSSIAVDDRHGLSGICLPITPHGHSGKHRHETQHLAKLWPQVGQPAPLQVNHTHDLNEIGQRIESRYPLRPVRHAAHGGEQATHQDEHHQEEKHDEHGLLHRGGIIGNNQPETRHRKNVNAREEIYQPQMSDGTMP